jgi:phenylpropionate dioxygenase-like ring-hydroxylating dioxygenase large terminal subunit
LEYLDGIPDRLGEYDFSQLRFAFGWSIDERSNWKVALDAQNETYHVPFLHSVGQPASFFAANEMGFIRNCAFERFGSHSMFASAPRPDVKPTPTEALIFGYGQGPFDGDKAMAGSFDFYVVFPNSAIVLFPGGVVATHRMAPLAPDRTRWEIRIYARPPKNAGEALAQELFKVMGRNALQEDAANHERIQSTLKSGAVKHFALQDEEIQIRFFHKMVDDYVYGKAG